MSWKCKSINRLRSKGLVSNISHFTNKLTEEMFLIISPGYNICTSHGFNHYSPTLFFLLPVSFSACRAEVEVG